jgi:diguanylate cyclase (GGDEF)-like protein
MAIAGKVLLIEDSRSFAAIMQKWITMKLGCQTRIARTYKEAKLELEKSDKKFLAAIVDLNLPDAVGETIVDLPIKYDIPSIVMTGSADDELRQTLKRKPIIDYLIKSSTGAIEHAINLIRRMHLNKRTRILVVDDSRMVQHYLKTLLIRHRYKVTTASDAKQAAAALGSYPDIRLAIIDHSMPGMTGEEFIANIRRKYNFERLAIIGISGAKKELGAVMMMKAGANDFITKPFIVEEFYLRIQQNVQIVEQKQQIKAYANQDFLTGLYNRRFLFQQGEKLFKTSRLAGRSIGAIMVDVDHFKNINDTYGHQAGDIVLKCVAEKIKAACGPGEIVARYGGEEFCWLALLGERGTLGMLRRVEDLRSKIELQCIETNSGSISVTISAGVSFNEEAESLDKLLNGADQSLYLAKEAGRNRVNWGDRLGA